MPFKKTYISFNGAVCEYHKIDSVQVDLLTMHGKIVLGHYLGIKFISPAAQTTVDDVVFDSVTNAYTEAENHVLHLPEWDGAELCIPEFE